MSFGPAYLRTTRGRPGKGGLIPSQLRLFTPELVGGGGK